MFTIPESTRTNVQFTLPNQVALYVPGTVDVDQTADNSAKVREVAAAFARLFGGASVRETVGYWLSETAGLVQEATREVFAFASDSALNDHLADVLELARSIKADLAQEAVLVSVNGQALFV